MNLDCAPLSPTPSPLPFARLHWRTPDGSEPVQRWKRTRMTRIGRIFTDFPIRANPCHPCNPCSTSASLHAKAPEIRNAMYLQFAQTINLRSSAFICGSFFAEAPDSKDSDRISVLLTLSVNTILTALGLRPQTPVRRRLWRGSI